MNTHKSLAIFKKTFLVVMCILVAIYTHAQYGLAKFTITLPQKKIKNSLYNRIGLYDSRVDTSNLGIVQLGLGNLVSEVTASPKLSQQLQTLVDTLIDSSASKADLLFHLRQFNFSEITGFSSETGYCYIRAELYVRWGSGVYQKVDNLDTLLLMKKTFDVTKALLKGASKTITEFITESLTRKPADAIIYNTADIKYADKKEKEKIPLYIADTLKDGLYETYAAFMKQVPDKQINAILISDVIEDVTENNDNGKSEKVRPERIYAVVYKGKAFKATEYGYYLLEKSNNDFYYTGKAMLMANSNRIGNSTFYFGIIGGLITAKEKGTFKMKLDHLNGSSIRLKRVSSIADIR